MIAPDGMRDNSLPVAMPAGFFIAVTQEWCG